MCDWVFIDALHPLDEQEGGPMHMHAYNADESTHTRVIHPTHMCADAYLCESEHRTVHIGKSRDARRDARAAPNPKTAPPARAPEPRACRACASRPTPLFWL